MPISVRKCACGRKYDVWMRRDVALFVVDRDVGDKTIACPACNGTDYTIGVSAGVGIELGDVGGHGRFYPRFDAGLGCVVNSAAHRKHIMKARNLVPLEGAAQSMADDWLRGQDRAAKHHDTVIADMGRAIQADPDARAGVDRMNEEKRERGLG